MFPTGVFDEMVSLYVIMLVQLYKFSKLFFPINAADIVEIYNESVQFTWSGDRNQY
jgi:hypothetical protein